MVTRNTFQHLMGWGTIMADKDESVSKLDALLNRIPVFDGGGRRRLTAGTIVAAATLITFQDARETITHLIEGRDASVSLMLAASALLIYAAGVVVELIGEVFLVRAVSNAVWSYTSAAHQIRNLRRWRRFLTYILSVLLYGTARAVIYFVSGLFGKCAWQMDVLRDLSKDGRTIYLRLPRSVRHSIRRALGSKSNFGKLALVSFLTLPETRRWAQGLLTRPRDVLSLVSAIVLSFTLAIFGAPNHFRPNRETAKSFLSAEQSFITSHSALQAAASMGADGDLEKLLEQLALELSANPLAFTNGQFTRALDAAYADLLPRRSILISGPYFEEPKPDPTVIKAMRQAAEQYKTVVARVDDSVISLMRAHETAEQEFRSDRSRKVLLKILAAAATLFLYVAFFNSLRSATLSVLEALALDHEDAPRSKSPAGAEVRAL